MRNIRSRVLAPVLVGVLGLGLAACGGGDSGGGEAPADVQADVSVTGTNGLAFEPSELTAEAGEITIALTAEDSVEHTFLIEGVSEEPIVDAAAGETATGTVELEAGTYTFYCDVPGHRTAGMEGTLTVE